VLTAQAAYEAHREQVARLQSFVDRFGAKTMGAGLGAVASQDHIAAAPKAPVLGDGPLAPQLLELRRPCHLTNRRRSRHLPR